MNYWSEIYSMDGYPVEAEIQTINGKQSYTGKMRYGKRKK